jgi:cytochrome P450
MTQPETIAEPAPQTLPPKPVPRPDKVSLWRYMRLFRADILSAQPQRLYRAWMAEFRTLFFRSYLINDPALIARVLQQSPDDFPKSNRIREGLAPLLGNSVFVTNGAEWKHQRRIIDPAFEGGRLRDTFPAMLAAGQAAVQRMGAQIGQGADMDIEGQTAHLAQHPTLVAKIQAGRGLVQAHDLGLLGQRARHQRKLALPT